MPILPDKSELHKIGYFSKLHGFRGELTATLDTGDIHDYEGLETIYLEMKGQLVPYFIGLLEYKTNSTAKVKLDGIDDEAAAKALVPGTAIEERLISRNTAKYQGMIAFSPPNSEMSRVWRRS